MILLELTEKEFEMIQNGIIKERLCWEHADSTQVSRTLMENNKKTCDSVLSKLDQSIQPKQDVLVTAKDLFFIKSLANDEYKKLPGNFRLSNKDIEQRDLVHIALANAIIMWLNGKSLLKTLVKFDQTDNSYEFEEMEE